MESNNYYSSNLTIYSEILNDAKDQLSLIDKEKDSIYKFLKKEKEDTITSNTYTIKTGIDPEGSKTTDSIQLKSLK